MGFSHEGGNMRHRNLKIFVAVVSVFLVVSSGCIGESNNNRNSSSNVSSTTAPHISTPDKISFNVSLKVFEGSKILAKYSYNGEITYPTKNAVITLEVIYDPNDTQIAGNGHYKKIIIKNGTSVHVFEVPPASWTDVPENESKQIINEIFNQNPYNALLDVLNDHGDISDSGNFSVELPSDECKNLLGPLMWGNAPPSVPLKGWVIIHNGKVTTAHLEGTSGDKRYVLDMEVFA